MCGWLVEKEGFLSVSDHRPPLRGSIRVGDYTILAPERCLESIFNTEDREGYTSGLFKRLSDNISFAEPVMQIGSGCIVSPGNISLGASVF